MTVFRAIALFFLLLFLAGFGLLQIDDNYFDFPIGQAEAGLEASKAPTQPFTTAIAFEPSSGETIEIALAAKDAGLNVSIEILDPKGQVISQSQFSLPKPDELSKKAHWKKAHSDAPMEGKYKLRVSQDGPGRISVYFFQGPFLVRIIGLPFVIALLVFLIYIAGNLRRKASPGNLPLKQ